VSGSLAVVGLGPGGPDTLTPEILHGIFKKYFPSDRHTVVTLKPEA
jgi:precorrin-2 methylase